MPAPRRFIDLHTHTTASDGSLTPTELVALADKVELAAIAITDHDTTGGLAEARATATNFPNLKLVMGVEVSANFPGGTMHILGLGVDETAKPVADLLETLAEGRRQRNPRIVAKLNELGLELTFEEVVAIAEASGGTAEIISRNHLAEALIARGYVKTRQQAFDKYLANGGPAYVDRTRLEPKDTIQAIRDSGGVAVLAHPKQLKCNSDSDLEQVVHTLMDFGLEGIEAYHSDSDDRQIRAYLDLANQLNLFITGGSDFHGQGKPDVELGHPRVPSAAISDELAARIYR